VIVEKDDSRMFGRLSEREGVERGKGTGSTIPVNSGGGKKKNWSMCNDRDNLCTACPAGDKVPLILEPCATWCAGFRRWVNPRLDEIVNKVRFL
jgi:hypothetical protein